ncbi:murein L,D-transpeptidase family protein [Novosphingobium tardum]|uniref:Murein L,D-transpeptidase family protein n=1 Tax=Novosphingobium tardum TaxID=1538021 RepID=A0ABV8RM29_9SPHN
MAARLALALAALALGGPVAAPAPVVDRVEVRKAARTLTLWSGGAAVRTYPGVQLGDAPTGPKHFQGDERTPEGRYIIDRGNPESAYHLSLHVSYPGPRDIAFARSRNRSPGGDIFIHGQPNALKGGERMAGDWTDGCVALANAEMDEVWTLVGDGTPIDILP